MIISDLKQDVAKYENQYKSSRVKGFKDSEYQAYLVRNLNKGLEVGPEQDRAAAELGAAGLAGQLCNGPSGCMAYRLTLVRRAMRLGLPLEEVLRIGAHSPRDH